MDAFYLTWLAMAAMLNPYLLLPLFSTGGFLVISFSLYIAVPWVFVIKVKEWVR